MDKIIINKVKHLESKLWIAESEKLDTIRAYHRLHYCDNDCLISRMHIECCLDDFNAIKINPILLNKIYQLIKQEALS